MPTLEENISSWNKNYDWPEGGEEWSKPWGGSEAQWFFALHPRIHLFLPAGTILEIAPGHGRWTQYLLPQCRRFIGVDLSATCVESCQRRFATAEHASFHANDGFSLSVVPDASIDFAYSFDSLVHAEWDVMAGYLAELAKKLAPAGTAFIHHSTVDAYRDPKTGQLPENPHWRAVSVSAKRVAEECKKVGLACIGQECVDWGVDYLSDCFTLLTRIDSPWSRENQLIENKEWGRQCPYVTKVSRPYVRERSSKTVV